MQYDKIQIEIHPNIQDIDEIIVWLKQECIRNEGFKAIKLFCLPILERFWKK